MCPESMVTGSNAETGAEVVDDGKQRRLPFQWCPEGVDETSNGHTDNQGDVQPVDVLVPVLPRHGSLGDVRLFRVVFRVSVGLILAGHDWRLALV